jgi:hypothetical protein
LAQWFNPDLSVRDTRPLDALHCVATTRRAFKCPFEYMPGNTYYKGNLTVSHMHLELYPDYPDIHIVRARVVAHGKSVRLPPPHPFVRRGTFRVGI